MGAVSRAPSSWFLGALAMLLFLVGCAAGDESPDETPSAVDASVDRSASDAPKVEGGVDADWPCVPQTCAQLGAECGSVPDGCGEKLECGTCSSSETCGGGGQNRCGTDSCVPKTCAQQGASCGFVSDGCATALDCGGCAAPDECGGGGDPNQCGCPPKTCAQLGVDCGSAPDGCGGIVACGTCPAGQTCGGGGQNLCGTDSCTPQSCAQAGASCGIASDGCSDVVECGDCSPPDSCGGGGEANQCGCLAKTCAQLEASCGDVDNGCVTMSCGSCPAPDECGGSGVPNRCGCSCQLPHAVTSCLDGVCSITSCDTGWADCDNNATNGCETDTRSDTDHCGSCNNPCTYSGNSPECVRTECNGSTCEFPPRASGTSCNADDNECTVGDSCNASGTCVAGSAKSCASPPNANCYQPTGTCNPSNGNCSYTPLSNGTSCGTCRECSNGTCGNALNGTSCGNACRYCSSGACQTRGDGYQYDGTESHRCCGGGPVDISTNASHCGGCGLGCATGQSCQSVSSTTSCSQRPANTSGRCTCTSGLHCPIGRNGQHQTCRNQSPHAWLCAPSTAEYCAAGESFADVSVCPNYCYYP